MIDDFLKMLQKKKQEQKGPINDSRMKAKASVAKELSDMLGEDITENIKGMNKVTVASDSEEGLKKGLEKAEDALSGKMKDKMFDDEDSEYEDDEDSEYEDDEDSDHKEEMSDDMKEEHRKKEAKIRELEDQIKDLKSKR